MKILVLLPNLDQYGVGRIVSTYYNKLAQSNNFQVKMVTFRNIVRETIINHKISISCLNTKGSLYLGLIKNVISTLKVIKQFKPTIINSHGTYCNLITSFCKIYFKDKIKTVIFEHNYPTVHYKLSKIGVILKIIVKLFYYRNDVIIGVSKKTLDDLIQISPKIKLRKTAVIYNPFDIKAIVTKAEEISQSEISYEYKNNIIISTVGRLVKQKDYPTLLKAFKLVREKYPVKLIIIGNGPLKDNLVNLCHNLEIYSDVLFLGYTPNPFKYVKQSHIFVITSIWESFGNVIVEALALGKPVVSTNCGGPAEILNEGEFGLLAEVGNHIDVAQKIISLIESSELYTNLSEKAKIRALDFAVDSQVNKLISIFMEICKNG